MSALEKMHTAAVLVIGRTLAFHRFDKKGKFSRGEYGGVDSPSRVPIEKVEAANLVSSYIGNSKNKHAPCIDLDFPAYLIPSSTPGHFHLYIEKEMSWPDYQKLLKTMHDVGLIEDGFYELSQKFQQTYLRLPHIKKE